MFGIKNKIQRHKSLLESFISLSVLNALNVVLPLIVLPYLLRVVGPEKYGIYSLVFVTVQYVLLISNYGFSFSATKRISKSRDDKEGINRIFNAIIVARLLLSLVGFILLFAFAPLIFDTAGYFLLLVMGMGIVIGDVFVPVWLFQGVEKMRYFTIINVLSKLLFTVLIFFVVKSEADYIYIILLNSLGTLLAGVTSLLIVRRVFKFQFFLPTKAEIWFELKDGLSIFASTLGMNLYRNSNIFILSFFVSDAAVGIYSAAEKIIKAIQSVISPMAQALFPHLGYKFKTLSIKESITILLSVTKKFSILLAVIAIAVYALSPFVTSFFGGKDYIDAVPLIQVMAGVVLFGGINYLLGIVGLVNLNKEKAFFYIVLVTGLVSIAVLFILVPTMGNLSAAISMLLSELLLFVSCAFVLNKLKTDQP